MQISLEDALRFIRTHDKLEGWTDLQILNKLRHAINRHCFTYTHENGKLTGIAIGEWKDEGATVHVTLLIGRLKPFVNYLKKVFPDCKTITAWRGKKFISYTVGKNL